MGREEQKEKAGRGNTMTLDAKYPLFYQLLLGVSFWLCIHDLDLQPKGGTVHNDEDDDDDDKDDANDNNNNDSDDDDDNDDDNNHSGEDVDNDDGDTHGALTMIQRLS